MMQRRTFISLLLLPTVLAGCGSLKKFTGQRNDTVLPGEREDVLPEEQQRNQRPGADNAEAACDPAVDVECKLPEATASQDTIASEDLQ